LHLVQIFVDVAAARYAKKPLALPVESIKDAKYGRLPSNVLVRSNIVFTPLVERILMTRNTEVVGPSVRQGAISLAFSAIGRAKRRSE
jgi:hypothetical protein